MRNGTRIYRAFDGLPEQSRPYRMGILALCLLAICAAMLVACKSDEDKLTSTVQEGPAESLPTLAKSASLDVTVVDTPSPTNTSVPVLTSAPPTPTSKSISIQDFSQTDLAIRADSISFYPAGDIYEGDLVTIRIDPRIPVKLAPNDVDVRIFVDGVEYVSNNINWRTVDGQPYGLYQWVWDSSGRLGSHKITVFLDPENDIFIGDETPGNNVAAAQLHVASSGVLSEAETNAHWVTEELNCCLIHVISGTAADRDLEELKPLIDEAFTEASLKLGVTSSGRFNVFLADRAFGQGGYAQNSMVISYLDRDYIGGGLRELIVHEAVHLIDRRFASNPITFLSEGLAVWAAGGHYEQQDHQQRMAALLSLGHYYPLDQVIDNFYGAQHEIAYLQGAGFIDYLISIYGWESVKAFYSETSAGDGDTLSEAVDINLQSFFGATLQEIEAAWISQLRNVSVDARELEDLRTMLRYYDLVRRYQDTFDPSAYYVTAWLPDPAVAQQLGSTADFSRHSKSPINIALEAMLVSAVSAYRQGDYSHSNTLIDSVERVLNNNGAFLDPLSLSYLDIVLTASDLGIETTRIDLQGDQAFVQGSDPDDQTLVVIDFELKEGRDWSVVR